MSQTLSPTAEQRSKQLDYATSISGSPLSGRVSQALTCPVCSWNQWTERRGWHNWSWALKAAQAEDRECLHSALELLEFEPADLRNLLRRLGVPEEELILPTIEREIERSENGGFIFQRAPYGGVKIEDTNTGRITCYQWHGLNE